MAEVDTQLLAATHERQLAVLRHRVAATAGRIGADCDRMLKMLHGPGQDAWRKAVGDAWVASRQLQALTAPDPVAAPEGAKAAMKALEAATQEPRRVIVEAMSSLLGLVPVTVEDELFVEDARAIRDLAAMSIAALTAPSGPSPAQAVATPSAGRAAVVASTPRVLVVDDEPLLRETLRRQLSRLGYEVSAAESGEAALEQARSATPDVILTDINMPGMGGMELLQQLKADAQLRETPVIVVSSQDDIESVVRCIELGAEDHLSKPYELTLLQARLRASLERKRMRDEEVSFVRRAGVIASAAEAVTRDNYTPGSLAAVARDGDALGHLARVFDRMVLGLQSREDRLRRRVRSLRSELEGASFSGTHEAAKSIDSPFATGQVLAGRFEVVAQIGKGGMGTVYRALDIELKEVVAIKALRPGLVAADASIVERLKSEIRLSRKLSHRNILRAHDLGESDGVYFISMEFIQGTTIADLLDRHGRLSIESVLAIGAQLADALDAAHSEQIIHRDIKPANMLVDEQGVLKVMDFGLAKVIAGERGTTLSGFVVGTPPYMAPEQLMGGALDARSDLFAVGVMLYECLVGRPPFDSDAPMELLGRIQSGVYPSLRSQVGDVPSHLEAIIARLLLARPDGRIQTARELADRLADVEDQVRPQVDAG